MSWELDYKKKLRTADEALSCVQSGMRVYIQPGCAEPETLVEALMRRGPFVQDVEIVHMMTVISDSSGIHVVPLQDLSEKQKPERARGMAVGAVPESPS